MENNCPWTCTPAHFMALWQQLDVASFQNSYKCPLIPQGQGWLVAFL